MRGANTVDPLKPVSGPVLAAAITAWQARVADPAVAGLPNATGTVAVAGGVARITVQWRATHAASGEENRYVTDVAIPVVPPGGAGATP